MMYVIDRETRKIVSTTRRYKAAFNLATRLERDHFGQSGHFGRYGMIEDDRAPDASKLREFCASW